MVAEDAYESLIRRTYKDFETVDLDLLRVVMADDVVWHEPGRSSLAGTYKGPEGVLSFLARLKSESRGTFKIEVLDVLSKPERVVVLQRETANRAGKELNVIVAVEFEIHHEKITEVTVYHADSYLFDEFWGRLERPFNPDNGRGIRDRHGSSHRGCCSPGASERSVRCTGRCSPLLDIGGSSPHLPGDEPTEHDFGDAPDSIGRSPTHR